MYVPQLRLETTQSQNVKLISRLICSIVSSIWFF